ncbi:MAG: kynureninase [Flavobacteriales bacterium]|nr:kynureninase [Flavobacteriales bacterium]
MQYENSEEFALKLDQEDKLHKFRGKFLFPQHKGQDVVYFTGNSLGLQPKSTEEYLKQELSDWANYGVEGHFEAKRPWVSYHELFSEPLSKIVGAQATEVVAMNGLTTNLHLLLASFYRPTDKKFKIICEAKAFPSDQYALSSQVRFHGYDPKDAIIEIEPRQGEEMISHDDIVKNIQENADEVALVFWGGVNYYSGQVFDMKGIAEVCQKHDIMFGIDLAHAAGNVKLELHDWGVDFAAWCSYKYLNSGPGGVSGVFVHSKHHGLKDIPRFEGWWGHNKKDRFKMEPEFDPIPTAEAWQLSNAPVFSMAPHLASLDIFNETNMDQLIHKQRLLVEYLEFILADISKTYPKAAFKIITPPKPNRGSQLSVLTLNDGRDLFEYLSKNGVITDWREPNVIRMAAVPLYNSFHDIWRFGRVLQDYYSIAE